MIDRSSLQIDVTQIVESCWRNDLVKTYNSSIGSVFSSREGCYVGAVSCRKEGRALRKCTGTIQAFLETSSD